jgi:FMN phosphatase YigB (HAD superfamily)
MVTVDSSRAILFDLNETLMFGGDRLGPDEDFYSTYRGLGGDGLSPEEVSHFVLECCAGMMKDYEDPGCFDCFPSATTAMGRYAQPPEAEVPLLVQTLAAHEVGVIPGWVLPTLRGLSVCHLLGIVSNIWSPKSLWLEELQRSGITALLSVIVFSSDGTSIKPSLALMREALASLGVAPAETVFVGDSVELDIRPARELGMGTVRVGSGAACEEADRTVESVQELWELRESRTGESRGGRTMGGRA